MRRKCRARAAGGWGLAALSRGRQETPAGFPSLTLSLGTDLCVSCVDEGEGMENRVSWSKCECFILPGF